VLGGGIGVRLVGVRGAFAVAVALALLARPRPLGWATAVLVSALAVELGLAAVGRAARRSRLAGAVGEGLALLLLLLATRLACLPVFAADGALRAKARAVPAHLGPWGAVALAYAGLVAALLGVSALALGARP
jgi:hypothetical protein